MEQTHITIGTSKGNYEMPVATWDAIGILVNAHLAVLQDFFSCNKRKSENAKQGAKLLIRVIKRINR